MRDLESTPIDTHDLHAIFAAIRALNLQDIHLNDAAVSMDRLACMGMALIEDTWN